jgi:HK97 family phage portal protein
MGLFDRFKSKPEEAVVQEERSVMSYTIDVTSPTTASLTLANDYLGVAAVFRCTTLISSNVAAMPLELYERDKKGFGKRIYSEESALLVNPNKIRTGYKLFQETVVRMMRYGEAYIEIFRDSDYNPVELRLASDVIVQESLTDYDYVYTITDRFGSRTKASRDVVHLTGVIQNNEGSTASIFQYANSVLQLGVASDSFLSTYFDSRMFAEGLLTTDLPITTDQRAKMAESWNTYRGAGASGIPVLGNGLKYQGIATSPKETGAFDVKDVTTNEVAKFFGVPLSKLFGSDTKTVDIESEDKMFFQDCLQAYVTEIEDELSKKLFYSADKDNYYVKFDTSHYTHVSKEFAETTALLVHGGILSPNEARLKFNLPPTEDGDRVYLNYIPLTSTVDHFSGTGKIEKKEEVVVDKEVVEDKQLMK